MDEQRWNKVIEKKLSKVANDPLFQIIREHPDDNSKYLLMFKPTGGHYKDQLHILTIDLKNDKKKPMEWFPTNPPKVHALTIMFHTNISPKSGGWICLDILQDKWSPMNGFDTLVQNIILLLDAPAPSGNHLNAEAARLQQSCQKEFDQRCKKLGKLFGEEYDRLYEECFRPFDEKCKEHYKINKEIIEKYINRFSKFNTEQI